MEGVKKTKSRKPLKIALISLSSVIVLIIAAVFVLWHMGGRPSLHSLDASQMRTMDFSGVPWDLVTEVENAIETAVADGIRKFIIDVRGNGGGSSAVAQWFLEAMGLTIPEVGNVMRISPSIAEYRGFWHFNLLSRFGFDYTRLAPTVSTANNPNDVFVSVLTDESTFSAAMWVAMWVQDGGFGNVIGTPSRNAPTSFGNTIFYPLPYSGLFAMISTDKWLRPDANANPTAVIPDIFINRWDDALDVALEFMRNMED